jgi:hypothetical protein
MSLKRGTKKRVGWDKFGRMMVDKVLAGLEIWCSRSTRYGITLAKCYNENLRGSLFSLAKGLHDWGIGGVTREEIDRLLKMPPDYYEKYNRMLKEEIMKKAREL